MSQLPFPSVDCRSDLHLSISEEAGGEGVSVCMWPTFFEKGSVGKGAWLERLYAIRHGELRLCPISLSSCDYRAWSFAVFFALHTTLDIMGKGDQQATTHRGMRNLLAEGQHVDVASHRCTRTLFMIFASSGKEGAWYNAVRRRSCCRHYRSLAPCCNAAMMQI